MNKLTAYNLSLLFGVVFIAVGVLGFIPNPIVSPIGFFMVNTAHNIVHLLTGALILSGPFVFKGKESIIMMVAGVLYGVVALLGLFGGGDMLLGMVMVNPADNALHVVLSAALILAGFLTLRRMPSAP